MVGPSSECMSTIFQILAGKLEMIALKRCAKVPSAVQCHCSFFIKQAVLSHVFTAHKAQTLTNLFADVLKLLPVFLDSSTTDANACWLHLSLPHTYSCSFTASSTDCRVNLGTADELALDMLINALSNFSRE